MTRPLQETADARRSRASFESFLCSIATVRHIAIFFVTILEPSEYAHLSPTNGTASRLLSG